MLEEVHGRLCHSGLRARTVTVKLRYRDFTTHTRSQSLAQASDELSALGNSVHHCLFAHTLHRAVRLLGVQLSGLEYAPGEGA